MKTVGDYARARAAAARALPASWSDRVPRPTLVWLAAALVLAKLGVYALYGHVIGEAAYCSLQNVEAPLWNTSFVDWRELTLFSAAEEGALREFAGTNGALLVVSSATLGSVPLALHWACAARAARLEPRVVALDGAPTCDLVFLHAPWLRCLALADAPAHGSIAGATRLARDHALHVQLVQRARVAWRLLALGHDLVLADADVVFLRADALHALVRAAARHDIATLERADANTWATFAGVAQPSFALAYVHTNARTIAFYQLLHAQQAVARRSAADAYALCMRPPWRRMRVSHLPRRLFVDASALLTSNASRHAEFDAAVAVHAGGATARATTQRIVRIKALGLWRPCNASEN
jgi:hypothetical protein